MMALAIKLSVSCGTSNSTYLRKQEVSDTQICAYPYICTWLQWSLGYLKLSAVESLKRSVWALRSAVAVPWLIWLCSLMALGVRWMITACASWRRSLTWQRAWQEQLFHLNSGRNQPWKNWRVRAEVVPFPLDHSCVSSGAFPDRSVCSLQWPARRPAGAAHPAAAGPGQHLWGQHHRQGGVCSCFNKSCPALWGRAGCCCGEEEGEPRCGALANHCGSRWDSVQAPSAVSTLVPLPFAVCLFSLWKHTCTSFLLRWLKTWEGVRIQHISLHFVISLS